MVGVAGSTPVAPTNKNIKVLKNPSFAGTPKGQRKGSRTPTPPSFTLRDRCSTAPRQRDGGRLTSTHPPSISTGTPLPRPSVHLLGHAKIPNRRDRTTPRHHEFIRQPVPHDTCTLVEIVAMRSHADFGELHQQRLVVRYAEHREQLAVVVAATSTTARPFAGSSIGSTALTAAESRRANEMRRR